jgi:hypothetical protein
LTINRNCRPHDLLHHELAKKQSTATGWSQSVSIGKKLANPSKIGNAKVIWEAEVRVLRANLKWKLVSQLVGSCLVLMLTLGISSCEQPPAVKDTSSMTIGSAALTVTDGPLAEVNTPASILQLAPSLEKYHPQVEILSPQPDRILSDDRVTVKLKVTDLPLFKQPELGLGNHLHVILDKQTDRVVSDVNQPLVFENLAPGTHSLRVFAERPWHESFKNEGAFDRVTFHILTKTAENNPDPQQPLLTYSRPAGTYGVEPIMLDYYLTNAPSHPVSPGSPESLPDWRVRVTINDQRFMLDRWAPVYLQGFKEGKNWVRLELIDNRGNLLPNVYNDTVGIINYTPGMKDPLAQLIRGELNPNLARSLVDPTYTPPVASVPTPVPSIAPTPASTPAPVLVVPSPIAIAPPPVAKSTPTPVIIPTPIAKTNPNPQPTPIPIDKARPTPEPKPAQHAPERSSELPSKLPDLPTPSISPSPVPAPIAIVPIPAPEIESTPVQKPAPEVAKTSPSPEQTQVSIAVPTLPPTATSQPPAVVIVPPQIQVTEAPKSIVPQPVIPQQPIPASPPSIPAPQLDRKQQPPALVNPSVVVVTAEKPWQTQALELMDAAKSKIRTFTNTIPSKFQRFSHNVQIWTGKAIEFIDGLRDSPKERLRQRG